jgi:hypothetical protein
MNERPRVEVETEGWFAEALGPSPAPRGEGPPRMGWRARLAGVEVLLRAAADPDLAPHRERYLDAALAEVRAMIDGDDVQPPRRTSDMQAPEHGRQ